jgi:uncharacterized protein YodC (DUF2158 family)
MANFEPGDIVQIKSGGPIMTVTQISAKDVTCLWFSEQAGDVRTATVPMIALEKVDLADDEDEDEFEDD